ncbi:Astra associated protein 1 Asa1 [Gnomoniopsis smithogilvyi]|uniref:ASTRA-associated protein 1 n=1 Tax=Gnomoniopsis smithogilvyi TaxID=1191159 RepID=A0A9W9CS50_9PEZI|nr:Astra associated protein 1 Asa1 [Gnomoniopsis smithogilvyi]
MATVDQHETAPPQPKYVLRGHKAQVHAVAFLRANQRLFTGDADGFVVAWDLAIMRPRAVWQAHDNAILGIGEWGLHNIITHGRDNRLIVWKLSADEEPAMSTILPLDPVSEPRPKPWMLHLLHVNTMNFCSFASCPASAPTVASSPSRSQLVPELLIAVPNTLALEAVDIYHLPSQIRLHTVPLVGDHGMPMALGLVWLNDTLTLVIAYEDGTTIVTRLGNDGSWLEVYRSQCHKQPVLSLDLASNLEYFLTSSADATIVKHPLRLGQPAFTTFVDADPPTADSNTKQFFHRMSENGGLEQHTTNEKSGSLLSAALASRTASTAPRPAGRLDILTQPLKILNTKHAGQQGLRIRSDGRIFATAGWDSKIRVYSSKSMREVAVLKWHSVGCFAVAFADISCNDPGSTEPTAFQAMKNEELANTSLVPKGLNTTVKNKRLQRVKNTHWLAAGSKDGKT